MTKPVVTLRNTKGSALTYNELDTNFENLRDATITVSDGTNSKAIDLNGTIQFTAAGTVTIGVNPSTGAITITGTGSGNVNSGAANALAYYPSAGSTVDDTRLVYSYDSGSQVVTLDSGTDLLKLSGTGLTLDAGGTVSLSANVQIQYGGIVTTDTNNFEVDPGDANVIGSTSGGAQTYANNATVDFSNFSGVIIVNRQDAGSGNVALWLCGGGVTSKIGDSQGDQSGTVSSYALANGYRWTNNTGGSITVNFFSIKTRGSG